MIVPGEARAEFLYFADGGRLQVAAEVRGDVVRFVTPSGPVAFPLGDFVAVVPGGSPEREWPARLRAAEGGDAAARFAAAWWALENGLAPESVALLRSAHASDPSHGPTARLVAALDRLDVPCADPDTSTLRTALGVPCEAARSAHVLLLHQHSAADAAARLDLLERVVLSYYLLFAGHGVDVAVPRRRLVSVYLKDRDDYLAFLRGQDAGAFHGTLGYYHPTFRAVVAYDARSPRKTSARPRASLGNDRDDAAPTAPEVAGDPAARASLRRRVLDEFAALARDHGTAAHEMTHLLVVASGLEPRPGAFPLWLHEGLAAQFEVVRGGRWAGIGRVNDLRLPDVHALPDGPALPALVRDTGFGRGYRRDLYARCWGLVYFLRQTHPRAFRSFLDLLRAPSPAPPDPDHFAAIFLNAFGPDLPALETDWNAFLSPLRSPLDEHSPADPRNRE